MTKITSTYSVLSHLNTAVHKSFAYLSQSPLVNYLNNFLRSKKNSGAVNSGVTASTLPPLASGGIGKRSNNMSQIKERRVTNHSNSAYSLKAMRQAIPCGLPHGLK